MKGTLTPLPRRTKATIRITPHSWKDALGLLIKSKSEISLSCLSPYVLLTPSDGSPAPRLKSESTGLVTKVVAGLEEDILIHQMRNRKELLETSRFGFWREEGQTIGNSRVRNQTNELLCDCAIGAEDFGPINEDHKILS